MKAPPTWLVAAVALAGCATPGAADATSSFGALLARTLLILAAVCVLAVASLRWAASRGLGTSNSERRLDVVERVPVGNRQAVLAVRAGSRVLLVGASPGRLDRLGEVPLRDWAGADASMVLADATPLDTSGGESPSDRTHRSFADVLDDPEAA